MELLTQAGKVQGVEVLLTEPNSHLWLPERSRCLKMKLLLKPELKEWDWEEDVGVYLDVSLLPSYFLLVFSIVGIQLEAQVQLILIFRLELSRAWVGAEKSQEKDGVCRKGGVCRERC